MDGKPLHVLLVEDDPYHAELVGFALDDQQVASTVHHVSDGHPQGPQAIRVRLQGLGGNDEQEQLGIGF